MLESLPFVALAAFVILQMTAAAYDFFALTIPNPVTYGIAAGFLVLGLLHPADLDWAGHLGAAAIVFVIGAILFHFNLLGGGDVKLNAACALWVGMVELPDYLLYVAVLGLILSIVLVVMRTVLAWVFVRLSQPPLVRLPQALYPGGGVPYGVAIAGGAILMALP